MKRTIKIVLISVAVVILLLALFLFYHIFKDNNSTSPNNINLPSTWLYIQTNESIPNNLETSPQAISDNLIFENSTQYAYTCKNRLDTITKKYFIQNIDCSSRKTDVHGSCMQYRFALMCKDKYFILESFSDEPLKVYGPFDIK